MSLENVLIDRKSFGALAEGEEVTIVVRSTEELEPDVTLTLTRAYPVGDHPLYDLWSEQHTFGPGKYDEQAQRHEYRVSFTVALQTIDVGLQSSCEIAVKVEATNRGSKERVFADISEKLVVVRIFVTTKPRLTEIMLHEFSRLKESAKDDPAKREDPANWEFDPAPAQKVIDELTLEQKQLLINHHPGPGDDRLVGFLTLQPRDPSLRMGADDTGTTGILPNATFTVFHCKKLGAPIELVCHTRYFNLNLMNGDTQTLIRNRTAKREATADKPAAVLKPAEWQSPNNPRPPLFRFGLPVPSGGTDGMAWMQLHDLDGASVMNGNFIHGVINTQGCWMLFRNFNWPADQFDAFEEAYRLRHRVIQRQGHFGGPGFTKSQMKKHLDKLGYDVETATATHSNSYDKFLLYDRNAAYFMFMERIIGIKPFSTKQAFGWRGRGDAIIDAQGVFHAHNAHGRVFAKTFPLSEDKQGVHFHDVKYPPGGTGGWYTPTASDIVENEMGFKTMSDFVVFKQRLANKAEAQQRTAMDVFIYRTPGLPVGKEGPYFV